MKHNTIKAGPVFHTSEFADISTFIDPAGPQESTGTVWFAGRDLCRILGYQGSITRVVQRHTEPGERAKRPLTDSIGRVQQSWYVNESGLGALVLSSRLPEARRFRHYVTSVILPAVRKYGAHIEPQTLTAVQEDPEALSALIKSLALESERRKGLETMLKDKEQQLDAAQKSLKTAGNRAARQRAKLRRLRPQARFARQVLHSGEGSIHVYAMARLLRSAGVNTGGKRLFEWLRQNSYLCSAPHYWNHPTQASLDQGLMVLAERPLKRGRHQVHLCPLITGKGQQHFLRLFTEKPGPEEKRELF